MLGTFDEILAYFTVPTVVFVGVTVAAVFVLGRAARNTEEPVSVPWHPSPPLLFLVPTAVLLALMAMNKPKHAGIGLAVVLLGLPVYHLVFHQARAAGGTRRCLGPGRVVAGLGRRGDELTRACRQFRSAGPRMSLSEETRSDALDSHTFAGRCRRQGPGGDGQAARLYPPEYAQPVQELDQGSPGIVASHTLIPEALYHAFATFGALMSPELPLRRRQHEMIATMVSLTNQCHY